MPNLFTCTVEESQVLVVMLIFAIGTINGAFWAIVLGRSR